MAKHRELVRISALLSPARRRQEHRGAVAVEAALITPLIMLLLFGIIEFGFVFKNYLAVTSSVRAGARIASAEPRQPTFAQDAADAVLREGSALEKDRIDQIWVYKADKTSGFPVSTSSFSGCTVCVKFDVVRNGSDWKAVPVGGSWNYLDQNACVGESDYLGVYITYQNPSITGLIFDSISLSDHSVMRLEPKSASNINDPCKKTA
jgi:Flp pilus assembly protein TadG